MRKPSLACVYCGRAVPIGSGGCPRCAKPILRRIKGRYELRRVLGVDESFVSYEGVDKAAHGSVFVRVLRPGGRGAAKTMLGVEARLLQRLKGAAPTPVFVDAGELHAVGTFYCVYEFVEGPSLAEAVRRLKPAQIIEHVFQVLDGAVPLHEAGLVHCRLTPDNVLVTAEGEVRLVNFRYARETGANSHGLGAPGYKAPEQFRKTSPVTAATDVFAIGCGLYKLLTGKFPYPTDKKGLPTFPKHRPFRPSSLNPCLTGDVDKVLARALAIRPEDRYPNAAAMRGALWRAFAGTTEVDRGTTTRGRATAGKTTADKRVPRKKRSDLGASAPVTTTTAASKTYATPRDSAKSHGGCLWLCIATAILVALCLAASARGRAGTRTNTPRIVATPVQETSRFQIMTYPAAEVFLDGHRLTEAPSPEWFSCPSGRHTFEFVTKAGARKRVSAEFQPNCRHTVKVNLETGRAEGTQS